MLFKRLLGMTVALGVAFGLAGAAGAQGVNLSVITTDSADPVNVGSTFTYTVTVRNEGFGTATNVVMTDTLPSGVAFVSGTSTRGSCAHVTGTITCNLGTMVRDASATLTANVVALQVGTVTNMARAQSTEADVFPGNNSDSEPTQINGGNTSTDIHVSKTASPSPVEEGQQLTYTITVQNLGPTAASNIRVSDRLPSGVTFDAASAGCNFNNGVVTCFIASLASGATATRTIQVTPQAAGMITNNVTAAAPLNDPVPANNAGSVMTTVTPVGAFSADLAITKSAPAMVMPGGTITYTITVTNSGPDDTVGVVVSDQLPSNVNLINASSNGANCGNQGRLVTCDVGNLNQGQTVTITITVRAPFTPVTVSNTATVTGDDPDPAAGNNSSTVLTGVGMPPIDAGIDGAPTQDGAIVPDGGMVPDGGPTIDGSLTPDGGADVDGAVKTGFDVRGAGCGCQAGTRGGGLAAMVLLCALGLVLLVRRRR